MQKLFENSTLALAKIAGGVVVGGALPVVYSVIRVVVGTAEGYSIGGVILFALVGAVIGGVATTMLVISDGVRKRVAAGQPVNIALRLLLASGVISLAMWVVGIFAATFAMVLVWAAMAGEFSSKPRQPVAAVTPPPAVEENQPRPLPTGRRPADVPKGPSEQPPRTVPAVPMIPTPDPTLIPTIPGATPSEPTPSQNPDATLPTDEPEHQPDRPIEPLQLTSDTPPKEAYEQFVARYGAERVVRLVMRFEEPNELAVRMLQARLPTLVDRGQPASVYVSPPGKTVAAILAPVDAIDALAANLPVGELIQVQQETRMVHLKIPTLGGTPFNPDLAGPGESGQPTPPADDDPQSKITGLLAQIESGGLREQSQALDALAEMGTPEAAAALAKLLTTNHRGRASSALRKMGPVAETAVFDQATSGDRQASSLAFSVLGEIGTAKSLAKLQRIAKGNDRSAAAQARFAIAAIERRK